MKTLLRAAFMAVVLVVVGVHTSGTPVEDQQLTVYRLAIKGKSWALEISLPASFDIKDRQTSDDGLSEKIFGSDERSGFVVSAYLEKSPSDGNAAAARDYYSSYQVKSPLSQSDIRQYETGDMAVREYTIKEFQGRMIEQKNINCFLSYDGYWADVHISKVLYQSSDEILIDSILKNIKVGPFEQPAIKESPGTEPYTFSIPHKKALVLSILASWKRKVEKASDKLPPTLVLSPGKGNSFELMITPLWSPKNDVEFNKPKKLKEFIEAGLSQMLPSAVEKDVAIQEFSAVDGPGYYFIVTDKAPGPGEFPLAMFSTVGVGDLILSVTLLFRDKGSGDVEATIKMLQGVRQDKTK